MSSGIWLFLVAVVIVVHVYVCSVAEKVAAEKGHGGKGWFARCFWLGPLMLILVAGLPDVYMRKNQVEIYKALTQNENEDE